MPHNHRITTPTYDVPLCSGFGQYHTDNPNSQNPKPYPNITIEDIIRLAKEPATVPKEQAQWFIPSNLPSRNAADQRDNGQYYAVWVDIDQHTTRGAVESVLASLVEFPLDCCCIIYSSRSSTTQCQKWRVIIPLSNPVDACTYGYIAEIINDRFAAAGIVPDRASERVNQICYLPNRGEFYDCVIVDDGVLLNPSSELENELTAKMNQAEAIKQALNDKREASRARAAQALANDQQSPIDAYNANYPVENELAHYGYKEVGNNRWLSPLSQSGKAGVVVEGNRWLSSHGSDYDIGKQHKEGSWGDAFDLFCYYEHGNDRNAAIKAAGAMFTVNNGQTITQANQWAYMSAEDEPFNNANDTLNVDGSDQAQQVEEEALAQAEDMEEIPNQQAWKPFVSYTENNTPFLIKPSFAAQKAAKRFKGQWAYDPKAKYWYQYTGTHWQPVLIEPLYTAFSKMIEDAPVGHIPSYIKNTVECLQIQGRLALPEEQKELIGFLNGVLNTITKQFFKNSSQLGLRWSLPYNYDPNANCPIIKKWLSFVTGGDLCRTTLLQAWMGALLFGRADLHVFLHLEGKGGNGKGTYFRLCQQLIGINNVAATEFEQMETNRFEAAKFFGKRLVVITDSNEYGGTVDRLKAMTGEDFIPIERKHKQQEGGFVYGGMVMIASNFPLRFKDNSSGVTRRRVNVRFDVSPTVEAKAYWQDKGAGAFENTLAKELPGLVNWILELNQTDITKTLKNLPKSVQESNFKAMLNSEPVAQWLVERVTYAPSAYTRMGNYDKQTTDGIVTFPHSHEWLYSSYCEFCHQGNYKPLAITKFKEHLIDLVANSMGYKIFEAIQHDNKSCINGLILSQGFNWLKPN